MELVYEEHNAQSHTKVWREPARQRVVLVRDGGGDVVPVTVKWPNLFFFANIYGPFAHPELYVFSQTGSDSIKPFFAHSHGFGSHGRVCLGGLALTLDELPDAFWSTVNTWERYGDTWVEKCNIESMAHNRWSIDSVTTATIENTVQSINETANDRARYYHLHFEAPITTPTALSTRLSLIAIPLPALLMNGLIFARGHNEFLPWFGVVAAWVTMMAIANTFLPRRWWRWPLILFAPFGYVAALATSRGFRDLPRP